jgi:CubicO group peptidase (beta-lactamase class C family)
LNYESDAPYTEDSVSFLASMTKLITSIAALQVVEKGLVGLDDDLASLVPEFNNLELLTGFDEMGKPTFGKHTKPISLRYVQLIIRNLVETHLNPSFADTS